MDVDLERVVLGVDAERVEPYGLEHILTSQALEPSVKVRAGERVQVPDVQTLRRGVREHHQVEERTRSRIEVRLVGSVLGPMGLPLLFHALRVVHVWSPAAPARIGFDERRRWAPEFLSPAAPDS